MVTSITIFPKGNQKNSGKTMQTQDANIIGSGSKKETVAHSVV